MFGREGWILASLAFFMDLHDPQKREKKKKATRRIHSHLHLTLGQERLFICIYHWRVKFSFSFLFLVSGIVLWLPLVNFHFFWWVYIIILSDKYWENQAIGVTKVVRIFSGLLRRMWKKNSHRLRRLHRVFAQFWRVRQRNIFLKNVYVFALQGH